jgi:hypothetical protein
MMLSIDFFVQHYNLHIKHKGHEEMKIVVSFRSNIEMKMSQSSKQMEFFFLIWRLSQNKWNFFFVLIWRPVKLII